MDDDHPRGHGVTAPAASTALTALLDGLVDFAGLFPPAALPMSDAVRRYAAYRHEAHRTMLARFVVPVGRLNEFATAASTLPLAADAGPWPLAALAAATDRTALSVFNAVHGARWRIDTIEAKADDEAGIAALAAGLADRFTVYVEIPVAKDPGALVAALAAHKLRAKIRTGGLTPDAFPASADVARFLARCREHAVPFKATAGLHHPLRGEYPLTYAAGSPHGTMYGFLNVFLAAVFLHGGASEAAVTPLLEERDPGAIAVTDDAIAWGAHRADGAAIAAARAHFAGSFGSCSFEEPVADLTALSFLPKT